MLHIPKPHSHRAPKPGEYVYVYHLEIAALPTMERCRVVHVVDLARGVFDVRPERSCKLIVRRLVLPSLQAAPHHSLADLRAAWAACIDPTRLAPDPFGFD